MFTVDRSAVSDLYKDHFGVRPHSEAAWEAACTWADEHFEFGQACSLAREPDGSVFEHTSCSCVRRYGYADWDIDSGTVLYGRAPGWVRCSDLALEVALIPDWYMAAGWFTHRITH